MTSVDFIIVGAGAHGCATAYHLSKAGASVLVLDSGVTANGASGGPGKRGVRANYRDLRELPLMTEAYDLWPDLAGELGGETGYERTGGIYLIEKEMTGLSGGLIAAETRAQTQSALGIPTEVWDAEQIRDLLPGVCTEVRGGLYAPLDGVASQAATTRSYASAAQRYGAAIIENASVSRLGTNTGSRITSVTTTDETLYTARRGVLLANNAGAPGLAMSSLNLQLPLWTIYPQVLTLTARNPEPIPLLIGHDSRRMSVKILEEKTIMLSGGWRGKYNTITGRGEVTEDSLQGNISELQSTFPQLGELTLLARNADRPEAISVDEIPLIGPLLEGLFISTGWSAHGWALVPSVSRHTAQMMLKGTMSQQIQPFSPSRFGTLLAG